MPVTYMQMVAEAQAAVPGIGPSEAHWRIEHEPNTFVVDVREAESAAITGLIPGAANISLGMLPLRADREVPKEARDLRLQDRSRPTITTCEAGANGARGAKLLKDMGFTDVHYIEGGMRAWIEAGLPTEQASSG